MKTTRQVAAIFLFTVGAIEFSQTVRSDTYAITVTADAMVLTPATSQLGSISFLNIGGGPAYSFRANLSDGSVIDGAFTPGLQSSLDWVNTQKSVNGTYSISYYTMSSKTGTLTLSRNTGQRIGTYTITGTPIGTVSGQFGVVMFAGTLEGGSTGQSLYGLLHGDGNPFGAPQVLGLSAGNTPSDFIGTQAGMNYSVSLSAGNTVLIVNQTTAFAVAPNPSAPWSWLRGNYAKYPGSPVTGLLSLTLEGSDGVGKPWTQILSIPAPMGGEARIYRLVLKK